MAQQTQTTPPMQPSPSTQPQVPPAQPVMEPKKSSMPMMVIALLALVVIALVVVIVVLVSNQNNNQDANPNTNIDSSATDTEVDPTSVVTANDDLAELLAAYDEFNDNVSYQISDDEIILISNGLPDHETGEFPNSGNPNSISEQDYRYVITRNPVNTGSATQQKIFGVTLGGVPFDPGTAETDPDSGWSIEAFNNIIGMLGIDDSNAHVQPSGAYHYHGIPEAVVAGDDGSDHSSLVGFAADGFPIYARYGYTDPQDAGSDIKEIKSSWQLKEGQRPSDGPDGAYDGSYTDDWEYLEGSGDLDECGGMTTVTPEYPNGTYAYFLTDEFPFVPRCVMGTPDSSFAPGMDGAPPGQGPGQGQLPPR